VTYLLSPLKTLQISKMSSSSFLQEDVLAAELVSSYASIGLYWCQGTGSLQKKLLKKARKIEKLEAAIMEMKTRKNKT
jgi:hypothetical protein